MRLRMFIGALATLMAVIATDASANEQLNIDSATVTADGMLYVTGENFGRAPYVKVGDQWVQGVTVHNNGRVIVAPMPSLGPGTYKLYVWRGSRSYQIDWFGVVVEDRSQAGAEGPQGPAGPEGPQGPAGPEGPQGPQGVQGPAGQTGAAGPAGPTGATGAVGPMGPMGLQGPQGEPGAPGRDGGGVTYVYGSGSWLGWPGNDMLASSVMEGSATFPGEGTAVVIATGTCKAAPGQALRFNVARSAGSFSLSGGFAQVDASQHDGRASFSVMRSFPITEAGEAWFHVNTYMAGPQLNSEEPVEYSCTGSMSIMFSALQ